MPVCCYYCCYYYDYYQVRLSDCPSLENYRLAHLVAYAAFLSQVCLPSIDFVRLHTHTYPLLITEGSETPIPLYVHGNRPYGG